MILGISQGRCIAGLVMPGLKVGCLSWADAKQDSQYFHTPDPLSKRWIETGATLFDEGEVKSRRVSDRLDMVVGGQVVVGSRNRRMLPHIQSRDCLRKYERRIEVGIVRTTAVSRPPTRVYRELHQVREPSDLSRPGGSAARQSSKLIQIDRSRALRSQICVDEAEVSHLIFSIVVNVLGHVCLEPLKHFVAFVTSPPISLHI